jgi:hypothetical protein
MIIFSGLVSVSKISNKTTKDAQLTPEHISTFDFICCAAISAPVSSFETTSATAGA